MYGGVGGEDRRLSPLSRFLSRKLGPPEVRRRFDARGVAPGNSCRPLHVRNRVHYTHKIKAIDNASRNI